MPIAIFDDDFLFAMKCKAERKPPPWWAEHVILFKVFSSSWKNNIGPVRDVLNKSVNFETSDIKGNPGKKIQAMLPEIGSKVWSEASNKFNNIITVVRKKAMLDFKRFVKRSRKDEPSASTLYDALYEQAQKIIESHPDRIVHPQIQVILDQIKSSDRQNRALLDDLKTRLENILGQDRYWDTVSSVEASFIWNASGIETAQNSGISHYTVLNPMDAKTCVVCKRMHGAVFSVDDAQDYLQRRSDIASVDELKDKFPFPRESDIGHLGMGQIEKTDFKLPPYHGNCRDVIHYLD